MAGLRSEFGGAQFQPHVTVVGAFRLTPDDVTVDRVATGTFFYQCVYLLLNPTTPVVETSAHCCGHFVYQNSTPYMPHLSLLYQDLTVEEKQKAQERAKILDDSQWLELSDKSTCII